MKRFDYCVGNPPYNEEFGGTGDNETFASPVYHTFMDAAYKVADKVELIHPARFLFDAGRTPKAWNEKMLQDDHFKVIEYIENANDVFSNTEIKGGVAISYHDAKKIFDPIRIFTAHKELDGIIHRVPSDSPKISEIFYVQTKFNLDALYKDHPKYRKIIGSDGTDKRFRSNTFTKIDIFTDKPKSKTDICIIGVINNKRINKYIDRRYVDMEQPNLCF